MPEFSVDDIDKLIIRATQGGLPVTARPYHEIAGLTGLDETLVMERINRMLEAGIIRRIGVVPYHYRLGYKANGMSVWDVADEKVQALGRKIGKLEFVSHCYQRPRHLPDWPYNLFVMVHGQDRISTHRYVERIADLLSDAVRHYDVLYSKRILKKTGLRI